MVVVNVKARLVIGHNLEYSGFHSKMQDCQYTFDMNLLIKLFTSLNAGIPRPLLHCVIGVRGSGAGRAPPAPMSCLAFSRD